MANVKISQLPAASAVAAANEFEINEAGTSKKVTGTQISTFVRGNIVTADLSDTSVTAAELNYLSGVTSDVQTQFNSKASQEKGTFTATCDNSVTLHSTNDLCSYIKTGDLVTVTGEVRVNNNGSGGTFVINNLPYASASLSEEAEMAVGMGRISEVNVAGSGLGVNCRVLTSSLVFEQSIDNAAIQSVNASTNGYYGFTVSYRAA